MIKPSHIMALSKIAISAAEYAFYCGNLKPEERIYHMAYCKIYMPWLQNQQPTWQDIWTEWQMDATRITSKKKRLLAKLKLKQ